MSTFEDPIDVKLAMLLHLSYPVDVSVDVRGSVGVNFIIMLLYSCIYANYAEGLHFSAFHYCRYCGCPASRVCVCACS